GEGLAMAVSTPAMLDQGTRIERLELERRERSYRDGRPPIPVEGKVVILIDDGLATGSTMRAAVEAVRPLKPARVVVAVPVGAPHTCRAIAQTADEGICLETPQPLSAVGLWYEDFSQTGYAEVRSLLQSAVERSRQ